MQGGNGQTEHDLDSYLMIATGYSGSASEDRFTVHVEGKGAPFIATRRHAGALARGVDGLAVAGRLGAAFERALGQCQAGLSSTWCLEMPSVP
jgi:hypothetical protein